MEHIPVTPDTSTQTTPGTISSNGTDIPSEKPSTPITEKQASPEGQTVAADVGGIAGVDVVGSHSGEEVVLPDEENTGDVMGHQGTME